MERPFQENCDQYFSKEPSEALEKLMNDYGSLVLRTAFFYLSDRHLAEDICQEVFIRAFKNWTKFRGDSNVKTWLIRITINVCRDKLGLKAFTSEEPTNPFLLHGKGQSSVEEEVMLRLKNTQILQYIMSLPLHYQEVLYLYYYLDFSTAEISTTTGTPEGTVRGRLHRSRQLLKEHLIKEGLNL